MSAAEKKLPVRKENKPTVAKADHQNREEKDEVGQGRK
jgi:hypothetical protein